MKIDLEHHFAFQRPSFGTEEGLELLCSLFFQWDWNLEVKKDWSDWGSAHKAATSSQSNPHHQGHKVNKLHPTTEEGNCVSQSTKNKASKKTKSTKKCSITQPDAKSYGYSSFL